jgi:hypothetical protein
VRAGIHGTQVSEQLLVVRLHHLLVRAAVLYNAGFATVIMSTVTTRKT